MTETYVLVCQNADCKARGAGEILQDLEQRLKTADGAVVKPYMCFGACQSGPNIVIYPNKVWYGGVRREDVGDIAAHVQGGPPVERLSRRVDRSLQELIFQLLDAGLF